MVARAAMLLECAHLVSRCNHGDWPRWMKLPGGVPHSHSQPSGYRRNLQLQRATGRLFHQWAEVSALLLVTLHAFSHLFTLWVDVTHEKVSLQQAKT